MVSRLNICHIFRTTEKGLQKTHTKTIATTNMTVQYDMHVSPPPDCPDLTIDEYIYGCVYTWTCIYR